MNPVDFYTDAYRDTAYRMKMDRQWNLDGYLDFYADAFNTFLDIGCGRGESLQIARDQGMTVRGAEIVPDLCTGPAIDLIVPGKKLPYTNLEFDVVAAIDVLEHISAAFILTTLKELHRVCRYRLYLGISTRAGHGHLIVQSEEEWIRAIDLAGLPSPKVLEPACKIENYVYLEVPG